jgi:hypothetical protein
VAILSASEFEAVVNHVVIRLEKVIQERGTDDKLTVARDEIAKVGGVAREGAKLKALRKKLEEACGTVELSVTNDEKLLNDLWDLQDYVDYRA